MVNKNYNLQDHYLNSLRKEKIPITIYLINGARVKGVIKSFDNFVILIKSEIRSEQENQQLIYKHAISTIIPEIDVDIKFEDPTEK
jgi:host factor-I protein